MELNIKGLQDIKDYDKKRIDLHIHTSCSDGKYKPAEIVQKSYQEGISIISITDHDTISGLEEAYNTAVKYGIQVITGVELSIASNENIHILGYNFDTNNSQLKKILTEISLCRLQELLLVIRKLKKNGINININDLVKKEGYISIRGIANIIVSYGYAENKHEADIKYLDEGGMAHVNKYKISPKCAIETIVNAGGLAVLAHPIRYNLSKMALEGLIEEYISYGLNGLEVFHKDHLDIDNYMELAKKYNLVVTGGSDFHSGSHSELGKYSEGKLIPFSVSEALF